MFGAFGYGITMACLDVATLGMVKMVHSGSLPIIGLVGAVLMYSIQPLFFYRSLDFQGMAVMNLLWDVISSVLLTVVGIFYFKESLTNTKLIGALLSILAITLLSIDESA